MVTAGVHPKTVQAVMACGSDELRPSDVALWARGRSGYSLEVAKEAAERMAASVALRDEVIATGMPVYGVTTGFGDSNTQHISVAKAAALQQNLIQYHLVGSGRLASPDTTRATMLIRANCLARGYSGVRREVVELLLACLDNDVLPIIPERGSVGASGDLVPLCYLADMLTGHGDALYRGVRVAAADALRDAGLVPVVLGPKEGLGLINGTSFMSAFAVLALADAAEVAFAADVCTALSSEVLLGNRGHFAPFIHAQKPHRGQVRSARRILELLEGSELSRDHSQVLDANPDIGSAGYQRLVQPIQDRYSVRCAPHVVGVLYDTLDWADQWLDTEINSTNDNPLFDPTGQTVYNGGNFYGGHVGQAMDSLKTAVANTADLLDRQLALVVDEKFNNGLTPNLIPRIADNSPRAGLEHGFKGAQLACSALTAEALKNSAPASVFSRSTEAHNQDKVSMGTIAARDARTSVELTEQVVALHLAALCQAVDLRGGPTMLGHGTRAAYELVRDHVGYLEHDRRLENEIALVVEAVRGGALRAAVDAATSPRR
ncbi:MAG TPA: aromatic amino acid ammonia-lyase [Pseudonocardiaceae bacterium]|jgi:histidine ammonia-lyase/phenylalanine ammonia-lyase|nr:aromatic amino acid ammonia-lyase [Pseudonocardiaceae bacterium]